MIVLYTDFGWQGPYVGQMKLALYKAGIGDRPIVDLMHDAPAFDPRAAGLLLAALVTELPPACVVLAVVDPGVGGPRRGLVVEADGRWFVGPDNGLFEPLSAAAGEPRWWVIDWRPASLSATFHGRDLFAPVAARLARGEPPPGTPVAASWPAGDVAGDAAGDAAGAERVIYIDAYGNAMTGIDAAAVPLGARIEAGGRSLQAARTFSEVPEGGAFWYHNSIGLLEIAVNRGSAARVLGLSLGSPVRLMVS